MVLWLVLAAAIIVAGGYLLINKKFVPPDFYEARNNSAAVAQEIVTVTETSLKNLEEISLQDRQHNFKKALSLVRQELERSKESRLKAIDLTKQLGNMTVAANEIFPTKARNLAIEAISQELNLITHLILYNETYLNGLLQTLELKFSEDIRYDSDDVQKLVKNMNNEAREINRLNNLFNEKMRGFDDLVKT